MLVLGSMTKTRVMVPLREAFRVKHRLAPQPRIAR